MTQIITIENENNLNKKDWEKFKRSLKFKMMVERIAKENPGCQIQSAPYKAASESKMRSFDKMVANSSVESNLTSAQLDDFFKAATRRQLPSSMRN